VVRTIGSAGLMLLVGVGVAAAQAPGLPVINSGVARGFTLATMAGFGNAAAGSGTALGVSGTAGFRRIAVGGFVSRLEGSTLDEGSFLTAGGHLTMKVAGGPLVPVAVNLQLGAGYYAPGYQPAGVATKTWRAPIGLGISWTIAQPVVALKPWIAPRADLRRVTGPDPLADPVPGGPIPTLTSTETDFGLSGGIAFGFLNGLGIDVAFDRVFGGMGSKPTTVGLGVSFNFR